MFGQRNTGSAPPFGEKLIETNPGIDLLIPLWWALLWRMWLWILLVLTGVLAAVVVLTLIFRALGIDPALGQLIATIFGMIIASVGVIWSFMKAFRQILVKRFSGHQLVFLPPGLGVEAKKMVETDPAPMILLKVWWALGWRKALWSLLMFLIMAIPLLLISLLTVLMDMDKESAHILMRIAGYIFGFFGSAWVFIKAFRQILGKTFSGHKLVFLTPGAGDAAN